LKSNKSSIDRKQVDGSNARIISVNNVNTPLQNPDFTKEITPIYYNASANDIQFRDEEELTMDHIQENVNYF